MSWPPTSPHFVFIQACVLHHYHFLRACVISHLLHLRPSEPSFTMFIPGSASSFFLLFWKLAAAGWVHGRGSQWWQRQQNRSWQFVPYILTALNFSCTRFSLRPLQPWRNHSYWQLTDVARTSVPQVAVYSW